MKLSEFKQMVIELRGEKEWEKVENSNTYKIYKGSEKEQIDSIRNDRSDISYIYNPSEELQLEAIKEEPWNVVYIKNPTDKVMLEVLKSDIHIRTLIQDILRNIEDDINKEPKEIKIPTKLSELKKIVLNEYGLRGWEEFTNREEYKVYKGNEGYKNESIERDPQYIAYIHNPNTGQKKRALIEDGVYLNSINNPTDEDIEYILKKCSVTDLTVFLNKCEDDLKEEK
jgi:putative uncharacterized protein (fragment)